MAWKGVHISKPSHLSLKDGQLVASQEDGEVRLPLEDIAYIVLDTGQAKVTATLLSACMEAGIVVITTDPRHTPNGLMLPFHSHHSQARIAAKQIALSAPFKKRCWQAIVVAKIENQAAHLDRSGGNGAALRAMVRHVGSGDPGNVEARAAREYWARLFSDFRREADSDLRNKLLNYGYAVIRAALARALTAYGFLPCFGLHHASASNAFNLADDLIEPFRPLTDALARERATDRSPREDLTIDDRRAMAAVLSSDCRVGGEIVSMLTASEKAAEGLQRALDGQLPARLVLPRFADADGLL